MNAKKARALKRRGHLTGEPNSLWTPLRPATVHPDDDLYDPFSDGEVFKNSLYTVFRREMAPGVVHLSIRRNDRTTAKDWRDFQRIKNELCGPEWEGLELYPAESRLVDSANQYHLWVLDRKIEVGYSTRLVSDEVTLPGAQQRKLPPDWAPTPPDDVRGMIHERGETNG